MLKELYHLISGRRRSMLLSMFLPTFLFGDIFDADAASQRTYQPTQAQRRLEAQRRLQNQRIAEIRRQNAARNAAKAAAAKTADTAAKAAAPKLRYTWIKSQRYILLRDIAKFYGFSLVHTKTGAVLRGAAKVDLYYNKRLGVN